MAIRLIQRKSGTRYQVQFRGSDMTWITRVFLTKKEAIAYECFLKCEKNSGKPQSNLLNRISLDVYFVSWFESVLPFASPGHREEQRRRYKNHVAPLIGSKCIKSVTAQDIAKVIGRLINDGKKEQTQLHIYNLMRKVFTSAIESRLIDYNPVTKTYRPKVPKKETSHLNPYQLRQLLEYTEDKEYGIAIWLQSALGLRIGEVQALVWSDVDVQQGLLFVRRTYSRKDSWVRKEKVIKEFPKNKRHRVLRVPTELLQLLKEAKLKSSTSEFVTATSYNHEMLSYEHYRETLASYCRVLELPEIGTHGLRHSTAGIYMEQGATADDIGQLLDNPTAVQRYIHGHRRVDQIAQVIQLKPIPK